MKTNSFYHISLWGTDITPLIFIFLCFNGTVEGIRCYECSSQWNEDCLQSPPPSRYLKLCSVPLCSKFYAEENGIVRVERYCGGYEFQLGCRDANFPDRPPGTRYKAISCRCSDSDGCNPSDKPGPCKISILILFFLPFLFSIVYTDK